MPWLARGHACSAPGFRTILCPLAQFCVVPACSRFIFVSNHLPVRCARGETGWEFEWDEDALIAQAKVWLLSLAAQALKCCSCSSRVGHSMYTALGSKCAHHLPLRPRWVPMVSYIGNA